MVGQSRNSQSLHPKKRWKIKVWNLSKNREEDTFSNMMSGACFLCFVSTAIGHQIVLKK